MSTTASARNTAEGSRRTPATSGAQSKGSSARLGARERPLSSVEIIPEDSASNGPHASASGAHKMNGSTSTFGERQTGRVHLAARENLQFRSMGAVKISAKESVDDRSSKEKLPTRPVSRGLEGQASSPRKKKKASRGFPE